MQLSFLERTVLCLGLAIGLGASAGHARVIDGLNIPTDFTGHSVAVQTIETAYGDDLDPDQMFGTGSELDQLFVDPYIADGYLQLAITGNLEPVIAAGHQNGFVIFLDTVSGGEAVLDANGGFGPGGGADYLAGLEGVAFDNNFRPDYAITLNAGDGGHPFTYYVSHHDLETDAEEWLGEQDFGSHSGELRLGSTPNGWQVAFDNSNILGVGGGSAGAPDNGALSATTGLEMIIPLSALGLSDQSIGATIGIQALITNSETPPAWLSNQNLPGLPDYTPNFGENLPDYNTIIGNQYATVTLTPEPTSLLMTLAGALLALRRRR